MKNGEVKTMDNELVVLVREGGLESTKAKILLDNFSDYWKLAQDWEIKSRARWCKIWPSFKSQHFISGNASGRTRS